MSIPQRTRQCSDSATITHVIYKGGMVADVDGAICSWDEAQALINRIEDAYAEYRPGDAAKTLRERQYEDWHFDMSSGRRGDGIPKSDVDIARIIKSGGGMYDMPANLLIPKEMQELVDMVHGDYTPRFQPKKQASAYIYLAKKGDLYKIGMSSNTDARMISLRAKLVSRMWSDDARVDEFELHMRYDKYRRHGEWFLLDDASVSELVNIMKHGDITP